MSLGNVYKIVNDVSPTGEKLIALGTLSEYLGYGHSDTTFTKKSVIAIGVTLHKITIKLGSGFKWGITETDYAKIVEGNLIRKKQWNGYTKAQYSCLKSEASVQKLIDSFGVKASTVSKFITAEQVAKEVLPYKHQYPKAEYSTSAYKYLVSQVQGKHPTAQFYGDELKSISQFKYIIQRFKAEYPEDSVSEYVDMLIDKWQDVQNYLYVNYDISISVWFPTPSTMLKFSKEIMKWYGEYKNV